MKSILKLEHIQKYYGNEGNITKAIKDISFSVEAGEFLGIMGASGSGKTTLLNCISTIDTVSAGHIYLEEADITEIKPKSLARFRRENLGFVFQDFNLLDTLTLSENIALALAINKTPAKEVEPCILDIAKKLNISDILNIEYSIPLIFPVSFYCIKRNVSSSMTNMSIIINSRSTNK